MRIMFSRAADAKLINGFKVASGGPIVLHLQFADDTTIFCAANEKVRNVNAIMWCFDIVS